MLISFLFVPPLFNDLICRVQWLSRQWMSSVLAIMLSVISLAAVAEPVNITVTPEWVQERGTVIPDVIPIDDIEAGNYYLLVDNQIKVDKDKSQVRFTRLQQLIVNPRGLEQNSHIAIDFDPLYQSLTLHGISIIRDNYIIDKLVLSDITLLKDENSVDQGLYDGRLTANVILDDLRVGDVIDYSYSVTGANPVYQGIFSYSRPLEWSVPIHSQHVRVLWGSDTPLHAELRNTDNTITSSQFQLNNVTFHTYSVSSTDSQVVLIDDNTPTWYNPFSHVYFSELDRWEEVVAWSAPLYKSVAVAGPEVSRVVEEIKLSTQDPQKRVMLALNYVQNQIRYLGLEMGANSHQPSFAETTLLRRYGDCKDKVVLLVTLLTALDIEAFPVLVNTEETVNLATQPVSNHAFNHVITKVDVSGVTYWLDPTMTYQQGPLTSLYQENYHYGLVLQSGVKALSAINISEPNSKLVVTESYDLSGGQGVQASLSITSEFFGDRAQQFRYRLDDIGLNALQSRYEDYYREAFADLHAVDKMVITEDELSGSISAAQTYLINNIWQPDGDDFSVGFMSYRINNALNKPDTPHRLTPFAIAFPNSIDHNINIKVSDGDWTFPSETLEGDNPFFSYHFSSSFDEPNKLLSLNFNYQAQTGSVTAAELSQYIDAVEKIESSLTYSVLTYGEGSTTGVSESPESDFASNALEKTDQLLLLVMLLYLLGIIYALAMWRIDSGARKAFPDEQYYPVSKRKLLMLSVSTGGFYTSYWVYRNWKYIKLQEQVSIMPIARGIFSLFWYYPLFSHLVEDSKQRYAKNTIMPISVGVIAAILFFLTSCSYESDNWYLAGIFVTPMLLFPLAQYITKLNGKSSAAYLDNSAWKIRHTVMSVLFIPWILFAIGTDLTIFPPGKVMTTEQIWQSNVDFMRENKIINSNEEVLMFYSDGTLSYEEDGNGFTSTKVFSYWEDGEELSIESADYTDIKDLKIIYGEELQQHTQITIELYDESYFLLFVSTVDKLDLTFYQSLRKNWYQAKQLGE